MLRSNDIIKYASKIKFGLLGAYLEEDILRLQENYYGPKVWPDKKNNNVLIIGMRSGLEILRLLYDYECVKIFIVEDDDLIKKEFINVLKDCEEIDWYRRLYFCKALSDFDDYIDCDVVGFIRIDVKYFSWSLILEIFNKYTVNHICGEFDQSIVDSIGLYRVSKKYAKIFYWRVLGSSIPLVRREKKCQYEISVVIPIMSVVPWIAHCLSSLVEQTIESIEIIVVDNGLQVDTSKQLDEWALLYPDKIKVVRKNCSSIASARNAGLNEAQGEYIAFVRANDWVDKRMYSELYRSAIINGTDVAECGYIEYSDDARVQNQITLPSMYEQKDTLVGDTYAYLLDKPRIERRIYRKEYLIGNSIIFPEHIYLYDDLPFHLEVFSKCLKMSLVQECYYYYRKECDCQKLSVRDNRLFVYISIFHWLNKRVGEWCDTTVSWYILRLRINVHKDVLSKIEKRYWLSYLRAAVDDVLHCKYSIDKIELYRKIMKKGGPIVLAGILVISFFGAGKTPNSN